MGAYKKNLVLKLGPLSAAVDLNAVVPSTRSGLRRLCPEHHQPVIQGYKCPEGLHEVIEWVSGAATDEGWRIVRADEKPAFPADEAVDLVPVPADQLEANTFEGGSFYYCQPSSIAHALTWEILHKTLSQKNVALVAKAALRQGTRKLWRLEVFRDYLTLRELTFPEVIRGTPERFETTVPRDMMKLVKEFTQQMMTDWDKVDVADESKPLVEQWIAEGDFVPMELSSTDKARRDTTDNVHDLMSALKEQVERVKEKKTA